jgi:hypothetical protein
VIVWVGVDEAELQDVGGDAAKAERGTPLKGVI